MKKSYLKTNERGSFLSVNAELFSKTLNTFRGIVICMSRFAKILSEN